MDNPTFKHRGVVMALFGLILAVVLTMMATAGNVANAAAAPGSSPSDPIIVSGPSALPAGAAVDTTSTYSTTNPCDTTGSAIVTKPGTVETFHTEKRFKRDIPSTYKTETRSAVKKYTPGKEAVAPAKQYEFDKFVQYQKGKWDGNTFTGVISYDYNNTTYRWRDAGFDPVWQDTNTAPQAPGPVRGAFIHNNGGTWYYTTMYEYRSTGKTRDKPGTGSPATSGSWSSWSPQLNLNGGWTGVEPSTPPVKVGSGTYGDLTWNQSRSVVDVPGYTEYYVNGGTPTRDVSLASWVTNNSIQGWTEFETRSVSNNDATPTVMTYYAWSDNKVCETVTPTPTPTPTPEPPTVTPTTPTVVLTVTVNHKINPRVAVRTRCTGDTVFTLDNRNSSLPMRFKMKSSSGWKKSLTIQAGLHETFKKRLPNLAKAIVTTKGDRASVKVPEACPTAPVQVPDTGKRQGR